jgi:anti-repressor protein
MTELIKITEKDGQQLVSARELYDFLEVNTEFSKWCSRMFEYGFQVDLDFTPILTKSTGGRRPSDYALKMDCAKEISMIQRTEKGKQARKYFIAMEKKALQTGLPQNFAEALQLAADQAKTLELQQKQLQLAENTIQKDKPKVVFAEAVAGSDNLILIREFAKILSDEGFKIGQNRLFTWLRDNNYLSYKNEPYQNVIEQGLFEVIERTVGAADQTFTTRTSKITGKGQVYFSKKIRDSFNVENFELTN